MDAISLTSQQRVVVRLAARGYANKQIARRLQLSPHTVKEYLSAAYKRLQVENRTGAVTRARELGLI